MSDCESETVNKTIEPSIPNSSEDNGVIKSEEKPSETVRAYALSHSSNWGITNN